MGRLSRSKKAGDRATYKLVTKLNRKPLKASGLDVQSKAERKTEEYAFWKARGGTPGGCHPIHAEIPLSPGERIWQRIDDECIGGFDGMGCYPDPRLLQDILDDWWPEIRDWFRMYRVRPERWGPMRGYSFPFSLSLGAIEGEEMRRTAAFLVRCIGAGRAQASREEFDDLPDEDANP